MARTKSNAATITTIEEAEKILKEMCELEAQWEKIDNAANKKIADIKEKAANDGKVLRDTYKSHVDSLKAYAVYFRSELFQDKKTIELQFGSIGFRKAPDSISCTKQTAELLQKIGLKEFVRVKIEPDKERMLSLDDETLSQVGAARKSKEDFFAETKRDLVNQELAKLAG